MKRIVDLVGAAIALVLLTPVLVASAIAVGATSRGGILFRQTRIGRGGVPFVILKFRTMVDGAEASGGWSTRPNDPRVTKVGRLLRLTSIDELLQLEPLSIGCELANFGPRPLDRPRRTERRKGHRSRGRLP
jgi:lipopolysaccharide/colanic/teichoic acid biosynthesis glycosyltransferase